MICSMEQRFAWVASTDLRGRPRILPGQTRGVAQLSAAFAPLGILRLMDVSEWLPAREGCTPKVPLNGGPRS